MDATNIAHSRILVLFRCEQKCTLKTTPRTSWFSISLSGIENIYICGELKDQPQLDAILQ